MEKMTQGAHGIVTMFGFDANDPLTLVMLAAICPVLSCAVWLATGAFMKGGRQPEAAPSAPKTPECDRR